MQQPTLLLLLFLSLAITGLHAQTDIRDTAGGKRILFVDGDDLRPAPGGKRLLFVDDGDTLRPEPGGKRLLFIDADGDIRPEPGGVRLALWDGTELRRTPGGQRLGLVDGKDFRPTPAGKSWFYMDGPALSRGQLTAVLYLLKPELFTLPKAEVEAKQKEMAANDAATQQAAGADAFPGDHRILAHNVAGGASRQGSINITKRGEVYALELKTGETPGWTGIGVKYTLPNGTPQLWAAVAPGGATSLGVYELRGQYLSGLWFPINAGPDKSVLGSEVLQGSPTLRGVYRITQGRLPNKGAAYQGFLNMEALAGTLNGSLPLSRIKWSTGTTATGFRQANYLVVAAGWGADYEILCLEQGNADLQGECVNKAGAKGFYSIMK